MGLYEPITDYLRKAKSNSVRVTFKEVEVIIRRPLPGSAYRHREWWANNPSGHSHARSWVNAGWRTEQVDLEERVLVFSRSRDALAEKGRRQLPDPFGAMRGSVTYGTDVTEPTGEDWAAERGGGILE